MPIVFSEFVRLVDVCNPEIVGPLNREWNGTYSELNRPNGGSLLTLRRYGLNLERLPDWLHHHRRLNSSGFCYILVSTHFPVLYVGVSDGTVAKGLFGSNGRFGHHLRKLLAVDSTGTSHPPGWQRHSRSRYAVNCERADEPNTAWINDIQISIGRDTTWNGDDLKPEHQEGYVLSSVFCAMKQVLGPRAQIEILNSGDMEYLPVDIVLPPNANVVWSALRDQIAVRR